VWGRRLQRESRNESDDLRSGERSGVVLALPSSPPQ
jgi:hypothetical protein